ncbi:MULTISPECIES: lysophospholipid acyltransferase family protein [unclassified Mucilaginibacter]|uniref:lysophospholipid acyltransferase family protein n=1 Tax=unclassified Mucilaginibacter TaxID=2617802 RepID=UPI002AC8C597|nr:MULTISPECIES: lysophospholipid acyltransferase family protein [unclassified Mucilaginibacter]MEB0261063.1 lysophospholipid acyltransferase family protein [Mucilaginibacter sp. 10I4]MEB0278736.1 lysophospholipid acyltransferase family protein [Mucilaginibacter sp. 10B2]MEB0301730.1 lysophospholipid acyltransferase family protein [Mucilaginibacter sp. 5C4]WPX23312.1 lysophospholipid acyltransferase family protein [Mucilaginibacter sp. 5C4]
MTYPQKNKIITWFFHSYILRIVKGNFHEVKFDRVGVEQDKSVLLLANHFSWWDGFLMYYLNEKVFKKSFHVMVIEETVQKVSFFKYMGAFSVSKNSREMLASLDYAAQLLNDPKNLVLIFPQGKLYSNFVDEVDFQKGLSKIMQAAAGKFQAIMAATFIENLQYKKPTVNVYLKTENELADIQSAYQKHYNNAKQQQTKTVV